jgi:hypothetical protein
VRYYTLYIINVIETFFRFPKIVKHPNYESYFNNGSKSSLYVIVCYPTIEFGMNLVLQSRSCSNPFPQIGHIIILQPFPEHNWHVWNKHGIKAIE